MDSALTLSAVPFGLRWEVEPVDASTDGHATLRATAGPQSDLFTHPSGEAVYANAPRAHGVLPAGDFALSARVRADFASAYDAGVLLLWASPTTWAKLCFEFSPQREPMVVSVITRDLSDDANAAVVDGSTVWLRISRRGSAYAFHASADGQLWTFVRHFALESAQPMQAGFAVQSPTGEGCAVRFDEISYGATPPADLRDGS